MSNTEALHSRGAIGTVVRINGVLLWASALAFLAYCCWPTHPKWWGFALISICFALTTLALIATAVRLALQLYRRERAIKFYLEQGEQPKSSTLAASDALDKAGMH